jgi:Ca2+-transporting ATPase
VTTPLDRSAEPVRYPGLTGDEAAARLKVEGFNELPAAKRRTVSTIILDILREPMFLMLIASGAIYLVLGEAQDALMLLGFVVVIIGITFYQERKTERALEALRELSSPRAAVIRDGRVLRVPGREVVRGDYVVLTEGDRVPADAVVLDSNYLLVNESFLTGESVPVRKTPGDLDTPTAKPGGEDQPSVYSGTMVVQGQGVAIVRATGGATELGRIGKVLETAKPETTPLERETRLLVRNFALVGLALCALVVVVYVATRGGWQHGLLAGLTMAMAILPEEIPVVLTVFLALGAWRMSQKHALTRRVQAVQAIGAATVLCVDKTGTLTMNRMAVSRIFAEDQVCETDRPDAGALPEHCHATLEYAILASPEVPVDPMEVALRELGENQLNNTEHLHRTWTLVREYPLSRQLLAMSRVWNSPDGRHYVIAAKGAPEAVFDLCHVAPNEVDVLHRRMNQMADDGLRVIAVARARFPAGELPGGQHDFKFEFVGMMGFADPVRPQVSEAIRQCYGAGIRVVMITGDYPGTARNIARQIGLRRTAEIITGPELDGMDDAELNRRIRTADIFARVVPEQKLRLVNGLRANGEVAVMTGDGVNDAPALKSAAVGIAMGARGTDVAREAAGLVLLDDDFSTIVEAVRQGRRIIDNLKKAIAYILSIHVPIAGLSLLPVIFKWPLILLPVHVVFLELVIDPICSIVFEAEREEANVMNRPPRRLDEPLFGRRTIALSLLQGVIVLGIVMAVYAIALHRGLGENEARTLTYTTLVIANLSLVLTNRSWTRSLFSTLRVPNSALWWVVSSAVGVLVLILYVPFLRGLFRFGFLHLTDILICLGAGVVSIAWFEVFKFFSGRRQAAKARAGGNEESA